MIEGPVLNCSTLLPDAGTDNPTYVTPITCIEDTFELR
jgi:hypothetical protein